VKTLIFKNKTLFLKNFSMFFFEKARFHTASKDWELEKS
jgi:hypothetical protein